MSERSIRHHKNHADELFEMAQADERLSDPTMRRDYFAQFDDDDFLDYLQQTARLVRSGESGKQHFDGYYSGISGHETPDYRDKEHLLRDTWAVAKEFLNDTSLDDQDALDLAALTVAGGVLYTHPFVDGNGRTSRAASYTLSQGPADKEQMNEMLARSNGGSIWRVDPIRLAIPERQPSGGHQPDAIDWASAMAGKGDGGVVNAVSRSGYASGVVRSFIERHEGDDAITTLLRDSETSDDEGVTSLNGDAFLEKLVHDPSGGITNATELVYILRATRARFVKRFLQTMQIKKKYDALAYEIGPHMRQIEANEHPKQLVRKEAVIREFGKRATDGKLNPAEQQLVQHLAYSTARHNEDNQQAA